MRGISGFEPLRGLLSRLLAFAQHGHITYGSDWPFAPAVAGAYFAANLEDYPDLDAAQCDAIEWANAAQMFPWRPFVAYSDSVVT